MIRDDEREERVGARRESGRGDMAQLVEMLGRRVSGAIVLAGALIGIGIYAGGDEVEAPKYHAFAADGEVFRLNTESGTVIACNANRCTRILERGQDLAEDGGNTLFRSPPAVPAPAPQPAAPAQQQQAPPPAQLPAPTQP